MLNKMVANSPLDCLYTKAQGTKMLTAGWIHDLSDLENIEEIKQATLPAQWAAQTYEGKVFGLPYFKSMKCCLAYNRIRLQEAGLAESDLPKTWDEAYDIGRRLKRDGFCEHAIVMWWLPNYDSLLDNFIAECLARGDKLWDEEFNAVFDENTPAAATLDAWQGIWKDEMVPPDVMGSGDVRELFATGDPPFTVTQSYELKALNDPERGAIAGNVMMVPYAGQAWGFLDYGLYSIAERPEEDLQKLERRKRWVTFMGYKDTNGEYRVAKEWVKQANLGTGYPEVYNDPEVIEAYKSWMPEYPRLREIMAENEEHVQIANGWHAVWYPEWAVKAVEVIPKVITGDMGVSEGLRTLRSEWELQQKRYS
jgi:multiple sugar transport system substrate-binding protein